MLYLNDRENRPADQLPGGFVVMSLCDMLPGILNFTVLLRVRRHFLNQNKFLQFPLDNPPHPCYLITNLDISILDMLTSDISSRDRKERAN